MQEAMLSAQVAEEILYVLGALFGTIVLARLGIGRLATILSGAVLALLVTYALSMAEVAFFYWCPVSGIVMVTFVTGAERLINSD